LQSKRGELSLGDQSPLFYYNKPGMIDKNRIEEIVNEHIKETEIFLVTVRVSNLNRILVFVDTFTGITLDECVELHRHIEKNLDRNMEDFELEVSSPGLDTPFTVIQQYRKNTGKRIEVINNNDEKYAGILRNVTTGGFELDTEIITQGKKKELREIFFNFDEVKTAREVLIIK
jgi:ribosome maturation factor RimP